MGKGVGCGAVAERRLKGGLFAGEAGRLYRRRGGWSENGEPVERSPGKKGAEKGNTDFDRFGPLYPFYESLTAAVRRVTIRRFEVF
ncbi:hypothetical protein Trebr_2172 [Treponema brennaborense DSM 12168]|uniref:Uncharacterized protein n=1 Tax=Treponema brennaborense (strain DSM 12168 / CIP 105900 / DD5/3) TaxID=906968 RepID=F4LKN0_TREBD|nr:hypothetical protein Trebr_2172 [Treponema brennaborense DSM 12168]